MLISSRSWGCYVDFLEEEALQNHGFGNMASEHEAETPASTPKVDKMGRRWDLSHICLIFSVYLVHVYLDESCVTCRIYSHNLYFCTDNFLYNASRFQICLHNIRFRRNIHLSCTLGLGLNFSSCMGMHGSCWGWSRWLRGCRQSGVSSTKYYGHIQLFLDLIMTYIHR